MAWLNDGRCKVIKVVNHLYNFVHKLFYDILKTSSFLKTKNTQINPIARNSPKIE